MKKYFALYKALSNDGHLVKNWWYLIISEDESQLLISRSFKSEINSHAKQLPFIEVEKSFFEVPFGELHDVLLVIEFLKPLGFSWNQNLQQLIMPNIVDDTFKDFINYCIILDQSNPPMLIEELWDEFTEFDMTSTIQLPFIQDTLDKILDKISRFGINSLVEEEINFLNSWSKST